MDIGRENRVALYCSRERQCILPIEEQKEKLKRYCRHFSLDIAEEYVDLGNSKVNFNKMIDDIKTRDFNIVLSYSFDTLTFDEKDLYRLVDELGQYKNNELHLESTYEYVPVPRPLFKLPLRDDLEELVPRIPKKKTGAYPIFKTTELENPKVPKPINWVEKVDPDIIRFEEEEIFDNNGEYLGNKRNVYVIFKEITRFCRPKKKKPQQSMKPNIIIPLIKS